MNEEANHGMRPILTLSVGWCYHSVTADITGR
jgi:hypothetical protein